MSDQDKRNRVEELLQHFEEAMLVTHANSDDLRARPMMIAGIEDGGDLWFVTDVSSGKVTEIRQNNRVLVTMQGSRRYISLSGWAELIDDQRMLEKHWNPRHDPWFQHGPDDPNSVLIRFHAESAEYWDYSGAKGVRWIAEQWASKDTGQNLPASDPAAERHAQADLS